MSHNPRSTSPLARSRKRNVTLSFPLQDDPVPHRSAVSSVFRGDADEPLPTSFP